jgi:hypothetical protein
LGASMIAAVTGNDVSDKVKWGYSAARMFQP